MKKWSKLVLATMLSAGALLVSGCIENIEPEGIADLRGAKAELLRAQVALQAAQAAKLEADAALVLAQAKVQEAIAKQEEAKAKYEEALALRAQYEAEAQNITNESARADLEKKIADNEAAIEQAKLDAELYALQLQEDILLAEEASIKAQQKVEQALRDLAVAKATLTTAEAAAITTHEAAVMTARNNVETKTSALHDASIALARAIAEIDDSGNSTMIASLEHAVVVAQAGLEAAVEAEAEAKALLEVDKTIVDWDAKRQEYEADTDSMTRAQVIAMEKYNAAAAEIGYSISQIGDKIDRYEDLTGYTLDFNPSTGNPTEWGTGKFGIIQGVATEAIPVPDVLIKSDVRGDYVLTGAEYYYGKEDAVIDLFDNVIDDLTYDGEYYKHYDYYWKELSEAALAKMEKDPDYLSALERYNDAVAATKSGDYLAYFAKYEYTPENGYPEDYDFEEEVAEYNAALKAFKDGIAAYEAEEVRLTVDQIKYEEIKTAEDAERAAVESYLAKGFQDAESKYAAAEAKVDKAYYAHEIALEKRDRAIKAAEKAAGANEVEMETFEASYMDAVATDDEKAKHAIYVKALADIKKARDAYQDPDPEVLTDPESVWAAALDQWAKDEVLYDYNGGLYDPESVYADIVAAYNEKITDIDNKYGPIWASFWASYPSFSTEYRSDWTNRLNALRGDLQDAVDELSAPVNEVIQGTADYDDVPYSVNLYDYSGSYDSSLNLEIIDAPSFLCDEDGLVTVVAADLVDEDYFVWKDLDIVNYDGTPGELVEAANALWYSASVTVHYEDSSTDNYSVYADDYQGWPYSLPDYDYFVKMLDLKIADLLDDEDVVEIENNPSGYLGDIYLERWAIEISNAKYEEYYAEIPGLIEAFEAAKAEFKAYVAEKEAEIDAMRDEIESVIASLLDLIVPIYEEMEVQNAKIQILENTWSMLLSSIEDYIATYDDSPSAPETLEAFQAALETAYNAAVTARISAEVAVAEAEWAVAEAEAGNLNAVEIAQVKYDRAAEELAEAMAALDKATADLHALLAIIYGDEEDVAA